jgi:mediator of RNA polymerase II transcription subunit 14
LEHKAKLGNAKPSDQVEGLKFEIKWEPIKGAMGVVIHPEDAILKPEELFVVRTRRCFVDLI